jgi:hypothetical protein
VAELDGHPSTVVVEHGDELEPSAEALEVLPKSRYSDVVGVLELGDRTLRHFDSSGQLGLTYGTRMAELEKSELFEGFDAFRCQALIGSRLLRDPVAQV